VTSCADGTSHAIASSTTHGCLPWEVSDLMTARAHEACSPKCGARLAATIRHIPRSAKLARSASVARLVDAALRIWLTSMIGSPPVTHNFALCASLVHLWFEPDVRETIALRPETRQHQRELPFFLRFVPFSEQIFHRHIPRVTSRANMRRMAAATPSLDHSAHDPAATNS
jgi:hypothetical protein